MGGRLNASYSCVDRRVATIRNKPAHIWVPEPQLGRTKAITQRELYRRLNDFVDAMPVLYPSRNITIV